MSVPVVASGPCVKSHALLQTIASFLSGFIAELLLQNIVIMSIIFNFASYF